MAKELGQNDMSNNTGSEKPRRGPNLDALEARIRSQMKDESYLDNSNFKRNGVLDTTPPENLTDEELKRNYQDRIDALISSGKPFSI